MAKSGAIKSITSVGKAGHPHWIIELNKGYYYIGRRLRKLYPRIVTWYTSQGIDHGFLTVPTKVWGTPLEDEMAVMIFIQKKETEYAPRKNPKRQEQVQKTDGNI